MLADDVKIVQITEQRNYDDQLQPVVSIRVEYKVGRHGPFVAKFPKDTYTAQLRDDQLNTFANEVRTT
jgi:hypothetical protein